MVWLIVIGLLVIGLLLIVVEIVFIPGTTVVGVLGVVFSVIAIMVSYRSHGNETGHYVLAATLVATGVALYFSFKSNAWNTFALKSSMKNRVNEGLVETLQVGDQGVTLSALRPSGNANINGKAFEVRTTGGFVEPNKNVRVVLIENNSIIVEPTN